MDLITELKRINIIKSGLFKLKNGEISDIYFDFKSLTQYPKLMIQISYELSKLIKHDNAFVIGVPIGGLPYTVLISQIKQMPMIIMRSEKKDHGLCNQIEFNNNEQIDAILIEDVITSGTSIIETLDMLKTHNVNVKQILCILDRQKDGMDKIKSLGYDIISLFKLSDFIKDNPLSKLKIKNDHTNRLISIINDKQSNLVLSLDLRDHNNIISILENVGEYICAVKLHHDTIDEITDEFIEQLNNIKQKKNFMIIEDRKVADIPHIVLKQISKVLKFADLITVYGVCGDNLIKEINKLDIGILLVCQLSIKNNLLDDLYLFKTKDIADRYDNVVGFISQEKISDEYLSFTPGVSLNVNCDLSKTHRCIDECNTDVFIVGRDIYESSNVVKTIQLYRNRCFEKFEIDIS